KNCQSCHRRRNDSSHSALHGQRQNVVPRCRAACLSADRAPASRHPTHAARGNMNRFRIVSVFAIAVAAPLAAQRPMITQQALITVVENHKGAVLRYIDAAPDSMLGFRPTK